MLCFRRGQGAERGCRTAVCTHSVRRHPLWQEEPTRWQIQSDSGLKRPSLNFLCSICLFSLFFLRNSFLHSRREPWKLSSSTVFSFFYCETREAIVDRSTLCKKSVSVAPAGIRGMRDSDRLLIRPGVNHSRKRTKKICCAKFLSTNKDWYEFHCVCLTWDVCLFGMCYCHVWRCVKISMIQLKWPYLYWLISLSVYLEHPKDFIKACSWVSEL